MRNERKAEKRRKIIKAVEDCIFAAVFLGIFVVTGVILSLITTSSLHPALFFFSGIMIGVLLGMFIMWFAYSRGDDGE